MNGKVVSVTSSDCSVPTRFSHRYRLNRLRTPQTASRRYCITAVPKYVTTVGLRFWPSTVPNLEKSPASCAVFFVIANHKRPPSSRPKPRPRWHWRQKSRRHQCRGLCGSPTWPALAANNGGDYHRYPADALTRSSPSPSKQDLAKSFRVAFIHTFWRVALIEFVVFARDLAWGLLVPFTFFALVFGVLMLAEMATGRYDMALGDRLRGMKFWAILILIDTLAILGGATLREHLGIRPVISFTVDPGSAVLAAIIAAVAADFVFYWFHRFQHRFLWRFHSVHHSIENLSCTNSYHHWSEPLWSVFLVATPLAFIDIRTIEQAGFLAFLLRAYPYYIHSPLRAHVGPLSGWIVDNRFHRIHHSSEVRHYDRNFGALTTVWDRLFGTAYFPAKEEWPATGIAAHREPRTIREWLRAGDRRRTSVQRD